MWRDAEEQKSSPALRIGHDPAHRFHLELFHPPQLPAADRYSFLGELCREGKDPREVGILPYRAMGALSAHARELSAMARRGDRSRNPSFPSKQGLSTTQEF